jgi:hypothetical protein
MSADATCAICGRTILAGERVHDYVEGASAHGVCELCVARAERLGWRPAGEVPARERVASAHGSRGRLRSLLSARRSEPPLARTRPRPMAPASPDAPSPFERAVARFNSSEAGRTVAGLTRSLGTPWVSVGAAAGVPDQVRITVAWELSWYQWGVDIADELRPVFELGKGREIEQLDPAARQWNASVGGGGKLALARPTPAGR